MKLNAFGKEYDLSLIKDEYSNNGRMYLWLIDTEDWEPFCDITENHPEFELQANEWIIDNDFYCCFDNKTKAFEWLEKNIGGCTVYEYWQWYYYLAIN